MSVEHTALTARDSVLIDLVHFMAEYPGGIPDSECEPDGSISREVVKRYAEARLDRLVLEVQAEMPCYEGLERDWDDRTQAYTVNPCPSCNARAKLAELTAPIV